MTEVETRLLLVASLSLFSPSLFGRRRGKWNAKEMLFMSHIIPANQSNVTTLKSLPNGLSQLLISTDICRHFERPGNEQS